MRTITGPSGAVVLRSEILERIGVPHAFATRQGGVSSGVFASLNFGNPGDLPADRRDPVANIRENYRRLLDAAGCPGRDLVEVHQVHGAEVLTIRATDRATDLSRSGDQSVLPPRDTKADALITDDPARALAIRIADCAPVLLASTDGRIVAAAHAGWRGVIDGVVPEAIHAMQALGARDLAAAIGPCIGPDAFEVGPEVAAEFRRVFGEAAPISPGREDRFMVDLAGAISLQLRSRGVTQIDLSGACTVRDTNLFCSHRRDKGVSGRMAAVIGAAG